MRRLVAAAVIVATLGVAGFFLLDDLIAASGSAFLTAQRSRILAVEVAVVGIVVVELLGQVIVQRARTRNTLNLGIAARAILRTVGYLVLGVSIVLILAANPALAIGVGSVTGLVIGFSAQSLIGNAFAGVFLAISRPFELGDEITVMGVTGRVIEIGAMYTRLDAGERYVTIPSMSLMTQAVQRRKRPQEVARWPGLLSDLDAEHRDE